MGANYPENSLSARQVRALAELASGASITATAAACGVTTKTVRAWLKHEAFTAELRRLQDASLQSMARQLTALGDLAAAAVRRGLDESAPLGQQLRAAGLVYDRAPVLLELSSILERLDALERRQSGEST